MESNTEIGKGPNYDFYKLWLGESIVTTRLTIARLYRLGIAIRLGEIGTDTKKMSVIYGIVIENWNL